MTRSDEYADALRDLEELKATGKVDQAKYDATRADLLAELQRPTRSGFWHAGSIALFVVVVIVVAIVLFRL